MTGTIPTQPVGHGWRTSYGLRCTSNGYGPNQLSGAIPTQLASLTELSPNVCFNTTMLTRPALIAETPNSGAGRVCAQPYLRQQQGLTALRRPDANARDAALAATFAAARRPGPTARLRMRRTRPLAGAADAAADPHPHSHARGRRQRRPGRRVHARRGGRGDADGELERCDPHPRRLGRRLQRHGYNLHRARCTRMRRSRRRSPRYRPRDCATPTAADCIRAVYLGTPGRLRPGPGHPRLGPHPARRRRPLPGRARPADHRRDRRPPAQRLHPLLPPAPPAAGHGQSHIL